MTDVVGYYQWAYGGSSPADPPSGANLGATFTGVNDVTTVVNDAAKHYDALPDGGRYVTIGGGGSTKEPYDLYNWTPGAVQGVIDSINAGALASPHAYDGVVFDVESGQSGLGQEFLNMFGAAKANGLKVVVTISGTAPWNITDANHLMFLFLGSQDIDYLSPQCYGSSGTTLAFEEGHDVTWADFRNSHSPVVPSIPYASDYRAAQEFFSGTGITIAGYIRWQQSG